MVSKNLLQMDSGCKMNVCVKFPHHTLYDRVGQIIIARQEEPKNNESNSGTTIDALTTLTKEDFDNMWEFLDIKVNGALYDIMPDEIFNIYCG